LLQDLQELAVISKPTRIVQDLKFDIIKVAECSILRVIQKISIVA
jgi:hypothetical protein